MLARSHKMPDGSEPEAKSSAQPPWQLFICSIDVGGLLFLPPQPCTPLPRGALAGNWTLKCMQHKPSGICLCSGKRLLRAGTSQPSCPTQTLVPFLHPSLQLSWDPSCIGRDIAMGMEKQRPFMNKFCSLPSALVPPHEFSTKAAVAPTFRTA